MEHLEAFEVPPGRLGLSAAPIVTCKVRYSSVVSSLSAFVMFYHTLVLRGQPLMVDFWQPETPEEYVTVPPICTKFVEVRSLATCSPHHPLPHVCPALACTPWSSTPRGAQASSSSADPLRVRTCIRPSTVLQGKVKVERLPPHI